MLFLSIEAIFIFNFNLIIAALPNEVNQSSSGSYIDISFVLTMTASILVPGLSVEPQIKQEVCHLGKAFASFE